MISDYLLTVFFPQSCDICGKSVEKFAEGKCCEDCWKATRIFSGSETLCEKCGAFLNDKPTDSKAYCRKCVDHSYDFARAAGIYEKAILTSVLKLKRTPFAPKRITEIMLEAFNRSPFLDSTKVIPVPLSKQRFAERTFNQADVLAKAFAERINLEVDNLSVARVTQVAKRRAGMDRKARFASVENAFEVKRPKLIENQNILLIDDVYASGATVTNCAKILKKKGAGKVYVLTVARTI